MEGAFMVLSYGKLSVVRILRFSSPLTVEAAPSLMMLIFGRSELKKTPFGLGRYGYPCAVVSVVYGALVTALVVVSRI